MSIVNNTIIRPPVSIYDVRKILGNLSTDLGTLCVAPTINKWAKYKPVKHNGLGLLTDQQRKNVNYGITNIPVWTGNGALNKTVGGNTTKICDVVTSGFRLTHNNETGADVFEAIGTATFTHNNETGADSFVF